VSAAGDQAEGLRRKLSGRARIVAVAGFSRGAGVTTAAMNLSVELARAGCPVLLLDEHASGAGAACTIWNVAPRGALTDVAAQRMNLAAASAAIGSTGVRVLPASDPCAGTFNPRSLCPNGIVVIDAALDRAGQMSALARLADHLVLVMHSTAASITATYAGLKQMQLQHALQTFQFIVNGAADARQAHIVISNVMNTSSRYLAVALQPLGFVTHETLVRDAAGVHRTVCEAHATSEAAAEFRRIAAALTQRRTGSGGDRASAAPESLARAAA